jgi:SWI/SNF-related matrix-associated actin-dependent regulator of chromatin subfamily A-like protein 1
MVDVCIYRRKDRVSLVWNKDVILKAPSNATLESILVNGLYQDVYCAPLGTPMDPMFRLPPKDLVSIFTERHQSEVDEKVLSECKSYSTLRDFQKTAVRFVISAGGRAINASEMGTGKTATAICICEYFQAIDNSNRQLIICPASLRANWRSEFSKFEGSKPAVIYSAKDPIPDKERFVVSYNLVATPKLQEKLKQCSIDLLILDESHYVKNADAKRTKVILALAKKAKRVILLSGTPSSRSADLYAQLRMLDPKRFSKFFPFPLWRIPHQDEFYFASRYCDPQKIQMGRTVVMTYKGNTKSHELHSLLSMYMTRTTKAQALKDLPPKTRERIVVEELDAKAALDFEEKMALIEEARKGPNPRSADHKLMELVRETCKRKVNYVGAFVAELATQESDDKFLIFAHHHEMLDKLSQVLTDAEQKFVQIDGRTDTKKRQALVDSFQTDPFIKFAVLGISAAGVGLNLFAANRILFAELVFSDKDHLQCEDRAHRQGLTRPVLVQYLILEGSTDDLIWNAVSGKVRATAAVVDNKKRFFTSEAGENYVAPGRKRARVDADNDRMCCLFDI